MAWPDDPLNVAVELLVGGAWVDAVTVGNGVRERDEIRITTGRSDWSTQVDPSRARFTLDNRDGRWSPDYPSGPYYGDLKRNLPCRIGVGRGEVHLRPTGVSADVASCPDDLGTGGGSPTAPAHSTVVESAETTHTTAHGVLLPATLAASDRVVIIGHLGHQTWSPPTEISSETDTGWSLAWSANLYTPWAAHLIYVSDPLDSAAATAMAGATYTFTTINNVRSSWQAIRVTGARGGDQGEGWDIAVTPSTTYSSAPDPPSLTAPWGANEHRWYAIVIYGSAGETVTSNPYLASYTNIEQGNTASVVQIATAHRTTSAATENPGAMTLSDNENWQAATLVFQAVEDPSTDGSLDISGDIDLRCEFELEEDLADIAVTSGLRGRIARKSAGSDGWRWYIYVANGAVVSTLAWNDSGGVAKFVTTESTNAEIPLDFLHEHRALRVTLDVDNGASGHTVTWYTSTTIDGTWTQLGSAVVTAGTTSIKTNDADLEVGGSPKDNTAFYKPLPGKTYAFDLVDGIGGTVVANPRFNAQTAGATSFADAAGNTWTIGTGGKISNMLWRFHGELASLPVRWNIDGSDVTAPVEATGLFRRLRQGNRRLESALYRAVVRSATNLIQYWPMEEDSDAVAAFGPAVGTAQMTVRGTGYPEAASNPVFLASAPLPVFGSDTSIDYVANVDTYTATGQWQVRWLQHIPADYTGTNIPIVSVHTTDIEWQVLYQDTLGGQMKVLGYRGGEVYDSAWFTLNATGAAMRVTLAVVQNGSTVDVNLEVQDQDQPSAGGFYDSTGPTGSAGRVTIINFGWNENLTGWAIGHVTLQSAKTPSTELATELNAWTGETAGHRIQRLLREEGIAYRIEGDPAATEAMGPQRPDTLMGALEECAATDLGILHEPRETIAVGYRTRPSMLGQPVIIDLDYSTGDVAASPELNRDDNDFANDIEVRNRLGTIARAALDDGSALSVSEPPVGAGRYDSSYSVNGLESRLLTLAEIRLALSTVDEPRVSRLVLGLHHSALVADSALTSAIFDSSLGDRIRVTNNLSVALGTATIDQIVQGWQERIGVYHHELVANTTPYSPWGAPDPPAGPPEPSPTTQFYGVDYRPSAPTPLRTVATTTANFATNVANAIPGDRLELATGSYGQWDITNTAPLQGTAANPIVITPAAGATVTFTEIDIRDDCSHVWFGNFNGEAEHTAFIIDRAGGGGACLRVGWDQQRGGGHDQNTVDNLKFCGIHLTDVGYNQLVIKGGATDIDVINCKFTLGGQIEADRGEHIYIGQVNAASYPSPNERILVQGCLFESATSDVIDIKMSNIQDIQILDNYFDQATFDGTLTGFTNAAIGIVELTAQQVRDPQISILRNFFRDLTESGSNARSRAITTWAPCEIGYNIITRTGRESIRLKQTEATLPTWWTSDVKFNVYNNTCFDHNQLAGGYANVHFEGLDAGGFTTDDAARLRFVGNITEGSVTLPTGTGESSDNHSAAAAGTDFIGPITGTATQSGSHVGSGYQIDVASSIPATAGALGKESSGFTSSFSVVASGELAYDSGTTFTVPAGIQDDDILLVAVSEAGSGDPGAATASIPSGSLTQIYSDKPQSGNFQPRQTLLGRVLVASTDASDTCTVVPGALADSTGWCVLRGLTGLPANKQQNYSGSATGIIFPTSATVAVDDVLILHGSAQSSTPVAGDASTLDITVTEVLTQLNNNRGQWLAVYEATAAGTVSPGTLLDTGAANYDNWVGTITTASPS